MSTFAVNYFYSASPELLAEVRPLHRQWLAQHFEAGALLASGPKVDIPGALLIWQAQTLEDLAHLLDNDPFDIAGCIGERTIEEWNPIFSPWSQA